MARGKGNSGNRRRGSCGGTPKRDGSGAGKGNKKTDSKKKK